MHRAGQFAGAPVAMVRVLLATLSSGLSVLGQESFINIRVFLEHFLVIFRAEINGFALVVGADRAVSLHEADRAYEMRTGQFRHLCVDFIRVRIEPSPALIFHSICNLDSELMSHITLHHAQCQIDAGRDSTRASQIPPLHKSGATLQMNIRIPGGKTEVPSVMTGLRSCHLGGRF